MGSCFLLSVGAKTYLITALHVAAKLNSYRQRYLVINEKLVPFSNVAFAVDDFNDVAVARMCDCWFQQRNVVAIPSIKYAPNLADAKVLEPGIFFVQGYPGSQNIIKVRYKKAKRELLSLTLDTPAPTPKASGIADPISLRYEQAKMLNSMNAPLFRSIELHGMSGGVVFQIGVMEATDGNVMPLCRPVGVLVQWHKDDELIVGASMRAVNNLLPLAPVGHSHTAA